MFPIHFYFSFILVFSQLNNSLDFLQDFKNSGEGFLLLNSSTNFLESVTLRTAVLLFGLDNITILCTILFNLNMLYSNHYMFSYPLTTVFMFKCISCYIQTADTLDPMDDLFKYISC